MNFLRKTASAMDCLNCFRAVRSWFRHNTILIKSTLFILGLVWSTMMEKTFVRILITPLPHSGAGKVCDLPSIVVVNLHQGISSVSVVAFTYATGGCLLRFLVVVFSATASVLGVIYYMFVAAGNGDKEQLHWCLAMVVMASVQAALTVTMKEVLDDHFRPMDKDYYQIQRLSKLLWSPVSLVALEPLPRLHFEKLALVLITMMLCLFSVFLLRSYSYNHYAMMTSYVRATEADDRRRIEATRPVNLMLLWFCLLILSLVSSTASTFFFLEASTFSGRNYLFAILSLDNLLRFTAALFRGFGRNNHLRIGIALLYSVACCTIAMGTGMSVYWLTPQFFILALMVEVAKDGFQSLYETQAPSHLKRYGSALGELASGLGGALGLICIFIFRGRDLSFNTYCIFLAVLSASIFIFYLLVAFWDVCGRILLEDEEILQHLE
ncbi:hypothetical protein SASPL_110617 [Salvia splendens]|uniref:Uncharacterized protein n=1 Tax=Salvia splendens TaxID=180675 RepID=A0A8X8Y7I6_SALSN|nr:uncharacterized protein LOC121799639 [Salvia splendens]KAG6426394.1 hypothetical protein SASPL_110617 [Salvia splendens]